jgi:hypothetical protein
LFSLNKTGLPTNNCPEKKKDRLEQEENAEKVERQPMHIMAERDGYWPL